MKKRLYVIPIGNQYEQSCNAEALIRIGIDSYEKLDYNHLKSWLKNDSNSNQDLDISNPKHIIKSINDFMRK